MKLRNLTLGLMLTAAAVAWAIPARRDLRTVTQPDGTTLTVRTIGDEHFHLTMTTDGVPVINEKGTYKFATLNADGSLSSTGILAADLANRDELQRQAAVTVDADMVNRTAALRAAKKNVGRRNKAASLPQNGLGTFTTEFPNKGEVKVLVILVEYQDVSFVTPNAATYFKNMLNKEGFSENGATGSAYDYFIDQSNGQFKPQFDVYGPIKLAHKQSYYGANDAFGDDVAPWEMVIEAMKQLDPTVDFSQYDNDHNGTVDNVYIFYAGVGENIGGGDNTVWPHNWELTSVGEHLMVDNLLVDKYACSNEWDSASRPAKPEGIGTIVHEFSHVMGLPDLYVTTYVDNDLYTPQTWSVMDYGPYNNDGRTPPCYSIYERNAMKWLEPELIDGPLNCELEHIATSNRGYIIPTSKTNEFFLLENRQQQGWDKYVPGHGLLIWHIDFDQDAFDANGVNNDINHQRVRIVKANNTEIASYYDMFYGQNLFSEQIAAGWCWPGTSMKTEFGPETTPALKARNGEKIYLPLSEIADNNGVVTFLVDGGIQGIDFPKNLTATNISTSGFDLSWDKVDDADDYIVDITATSSANAKTVKCDMGYDKTVSLPEGWETEKTNYYNTATNYGEASPSLKFQTTGSVLTSEEFPCDIRKISFWVKGQGLAGSTLDIQRLNGTKWESIQKLTPSNQAETIVISNIPAGTRKVRFYYTKANGNLGLDDVVIESGEDGTPLNGFSALRTGGKTTLHVSPLAEGKNIYSINVRATKGEEVSRVSQLKVDVVNTGICLTPAEEGATITVIGSTVIVDAQTAVSIYDLAGRRVAYAADGKGEFTLPAGFYIVNGKKVVLK